MAKEKLVGLSVLAISVAGILMIIILGAHKAISQGAKATGQFAKAVYNLGEKLGPLLPPLLPKPYHGVLKGWHIYPKIYGY